MDLFAKPTQEDRDFQAWQQAENERLQAETAKVIAERTALMNTMTGEEWEDYLQAEAIENARARAATKSYETR